MTTTRRFAKAGVVISLILGLGAGGSAALAQAPDSRPGVDAPALAPMGSHAVGVRSLALLEPDVPDVLAFDPARRAAPIRDRPLTVDVWYPAKPEPQSRPVSYEGTLPSESGAQVAFQIPGVAIRDAAPERGRPYPLVVLSHGYAGTPVAMSWLAENLASKGYVVVAAHHLDPPYGDLSKFVGPVFLRPLDIAFLAHTIQTRATHADPFFSGLVDPKRVVLVGYSMGGYGVLTVAGAGLSARTAAMVPGGYLSAYAPSGANAKALLVDGLKAVVAISPAGGGGGFAAWDEAGLQGLTTPTLLIAGDQDKVVGYANVRAIFERAIHAPRYLLSYAAAGHSIGMDGAPETMRSTLWDQDWFEDPVWRKERIVGVNLHFITAFLDMYVKGDGGAASYLDVIANSDAGVWPAASAGTPYGVYSPGGAITVWKGFQRNHAAGLRLEHKAAGAP